MGHVWYTPWPMNAIDIHAHAFPHAVAPRAIEGLEGLSERRPVGDGTVDDLLRQMDAADVDVACVCPIATRPEQVEGIYQWCCEIRSDRILPFPSPHPGAAGAGDWIRRFADEGFRGVKIHPMWQEFGVDAERMDAVYAALAEAGLLVVMHCGFDMCFPTDPRAQPDRVRRVVDRHPGLKLVATHLGGLWSWDEVERVLVGRPVYFGTSFSLEDLGLERAAALIRRHGAEKVMFGTDWPWKAFDRELDLIERLDLTRAEKDAIRWGNAARVLGL